MAIKIIVIFNRFVDVTMKITIRSILSSATKWWHLLFLLITMVSVTAFIYIFLIPFVFWSIYGEGATSDRIGSLPIVIFLGEWLSLIIGLTLLGFGFYLNLKGHNVAKLKSYLLVTIVLIMLYLLRNPILDYMFTIFQ